VLPVLVPSAAQQGSARWPSLVLPGDGQRPHAGAEAGEPRHRLKDSSVQAIGVEQVVYLCRPLPWVLPDRFPGLPWGPVPVAETLLSCHWIVNLRLLVAFSRLSGKFLVCILPR